MFATTLSRELREMGFRFEPPRGIVARLPPAMLAAIGAAVLVAAIAAPGARAATSFTWSSPVAVATADGFRPFSCESATQCTAITNNMGTVVNFNPAAPGTPIAHTVENSGFPGIHPLQISCPAANQCTVIDGPNGEVTFNPSSPPSTPQAPSPIGNGSTLLSAIACPSPAQCTVVDNGGNAYTFNPTSPGTPPAASVDSGNSLSRIACPSTSQCTAVDSAGGEVTFNPTSPGSPTRVSVDSLTPRALSCPALNQCTVVDSNGQEVTFNPTSAGHPTPVRIAGTAGANFGVIACASSAQCTATGTSVSGSSITDVEYTFDPAAPSGATNAQFPANYYPATAVFCPSTSLCYMFTSDGYEFTGTPGSGGGGRHTLSVSRTGSGSGTVSSSPAGISCGSTCSTNFSAGTKVTLTAKAASGSTFAGWSGGGCSGTGACTLMMSADRTVTASFKSGSKPPLPKAKITKAKIDNKHHKATFTFKATGRTTGFQCALIKPTNKHHKKPKPQFSKCNSPKTYAHLNPGNYTFELRALSAGGIGPVAKRVFGI